MGNEMGNNNTSGLQEGENTTLNDQGTSLQDPGHANESNGENHGVSFVETDYYREAWIDSGGPKVEEGTHSYGHASSDGREQAETEVHPPAESPRTEISSEGSGMQPASLSKELEDHEKPNKLDLKENILLAGNKQLEEHTSTGKAEGEVVNSTLVSALTSYDTEPQKSIFTDHDPAKFCANQSVQDNFNPPNVFEDILESNIACANKENDHQLDTCTHDHLDGVVVSGINLDVKRKRDEPLSKIIASAGDEMPGDEKFEMVEEVVKGIIDTTAVSAINDIDQVHDGELISEINCRNIALESQTEAYPLADSRNINEKSCKESDLMRKGIDSKEITADHNLCEFGKESMRKPGIDDVNGSQTAFVTGNTCKNNEVEVSMMSTYYEHTSTGNCEDESAKVAGHVDHIDLCNDIHNEASVKHFMEPEVEVTVFDMLPLESSVTNGNNSEDELEDCKLEIEEPAAKQVIEIKEMTEASIVSQQKEEETGEHVMSQLLHLKAEANLLQTSPIPFQLPDQQQRAAIGPGPWDAENSSVSTPKLKPEARTEFSVTTASAFPATSLTEETLAPEVDLATEKPCQEVPLNITEATEATTESSSSASSKQSTEVFRNVETYVFARNNWEKGSAGRLSTESNPNNINIHMQMRKSPSFDFDLGIEARSEDSDKTPLLFQDKATVKSLSGQTLVSLENPLLLDRFGQESFQYEAMPVEEKVITLERSNSEKSRTPFLEFMRKGEEAHVAVSQKVKDNLAAAEKTNKEFWDSATEEVGSAPPKGKDKHKRRSSLFANCICCATVIN